MVGALVPTLCVGMPSGRFASVSYIYFTLSNTGGSFRHQDHILHIYEGPRKAGGKAILQETESNHFRVAKKTDDVSSRRGYTLIGAEVNEYAVFSRMYQAMRNHDRFPYFQPDVFFAGQICDESELHKGVHNIFLLKRAFFSGTVQNRTGIDFFWP